MIYVILWKRGYSYAVSMGSRQEVCGMTYGEKLQFWGGTPRVANLDIERVLGDKSPGQIICRRLRGCLNNVEIQGFPRGYVVD